jgi:hypothetical protein
LQNVLLNFLCHSLSQQRLNILAVPEPGKLLLASLNNFLLDLILDCLVNSCLQLVDVDLVHRQDIAKHPHLLVSHEDLVTILVPLAHRLRQSFLVSLALLLDTFDGVFLLSIS